MAAIGSAVGLGNIWRFPYVAFENGGGAFLIPYLVALLSAGIPLLWFDLALGHRFRGSTPLTFRRMSRSAEPIGWFMVGVNFFIAIYYAAIIAWAGLYTVKAFTLAWGEDTQGHFLKEFLRVDDSHAWSGDIVWPIFFVMVFVWAICIATLALDVNKGIGAVTTAFVPVLTVLFLIIVIRALFLPGAVEGLNAFFTPNWSVLTDPSVWIAAYGQIFFSLSIGFGIMVTYASYLKPRTNLTGTGMVTAFANSSFELLAGVGVFATLGFLALQENKAVNDVAASGLGLAFFAFPKIINEMPFGQFFGVLFFGCLFLAGITSLVSIMEVAIAGIREKLNLNRKTAAIGVGGVMAVASCLLFSATSGLITLDIMDKFTNNLGIVIGAVVSALAVGWLLRRRAEIAQHINAVSSIRVRAVWQACAFVITPAVLTFFVVTEIYSLITEPYEGYSTTTIFLFGWLVLLLIIAGAFIGTALPFKGPQTLDGVEASDYGVPPHGRADGLPNSLATGPRHAATPESEIIRTQHITPRAASQEDTLS